MEKGRFAAPLPLLVSPRMGARERAPHTRDYRALMKPLPLAALQGPELAGPWLRPMSKDVSLLLNVSRIPMQPAMSPFPLSHTLVGPLQQLLKLSVMPGSIPLQFPGCGACAVAARFRAAAMH